MIALGLLIAIGPGLVILAGWTAFWAYVRHHERVAEQRRRVPGHGSPRRPR